MNAVQLNEVNKIQVPYVFDFDLKERFIGFNSEQILNTFDVNRSQGPELTSIN